MEDGTFDELRKTIIERLKQDVRGLVTYANHYFRVADLYSTLNAAHVLAQKVLNSFIEEAVLNSKALASTKPDSKESKTDTYNYVRKEIE